MASKIIYGFHAVQAALQKQPHHVLSLYCQSKQGARWNNLFAQAQAAGIVIQTISQDKLNALTQSQLHQGLAAKVRTIHWDTQAMLTWLEHPPQPPLLLLLEDIQDPHNLGACLRSAQAFAVDWVILSKQCAPLNATVSKVACGGDQLPIVIASNLVRLIEQIQEKGIWVIGTALQATLSISEINGQLPLAVVMGSEQKGLKRLTLERCDQMVKIPMRGAMNSINVSVATGICLYEYQRQRLLIE